MKKIFMVLIATFAMAMTVNACPEWECQLDIDDYSCGGVHSCITQTTVTTTYQYDEYSTTRQPIYCQYCGHETWDCVCGGEYVSNSSGCINYDYDYDYDYDCDYEQNYSVTGGSGSGSCRMDHWANVRDCNGNIIGTVGEGSCITVIGVDSNNSERVLIYDSVTGTYGSVLASCVYGGYEYTGNYNYNENGGCIDYDYNCNNNGCIDYDYDYDCDCYNNQCDEYDCNNYDECNYSNLDCGYYGGYCEDNWNYGSCGGYNVGCINAYSNSYMVQVCETIVQRCVTTYSFGGSSFGYKCGVKNWC